MQYHNLGREYLAKVELPACYQADCKRVFEYLYPTDVAGEPAARGVARRVSQQEYDQWLARARAEATPVDRDTATRLRAMLQHLNN